jgi:hypothetical protein
VSAEVLGDERGGRIVVVEEEIGDGAGGAIRVEMDEAIGRPEADFGVLEAREPGEIFE